MWYLGVEVVDALNGVLYVATLHRLADGRAIGDAVQVHPNCSSTPPHTTFESTDRGKEGVCV